MQGNIYYCNEGIEKEEVIPLVVPTLEAATTYNTFIIVPSTEDDINLIDHYEVEYSVPDSNGNTLDVITDPSGTCNISPTESSFTLEVQYGGDLRVRIKAVGKQNNESEYSKVYIFQNKVYEMVTNFNGGTYNSAIKMTQYKYYNRDMTWASGYNPTKTDYKFLGWSRSSSATSASSIYADGAVCTSNANITRYAVWEITSITVENCKADEILYIYVDNYKETNTRTLNYTLEGFTYTFKGQYEKTRDVLYSGLNNVTSVHKVYKCPTSEYIFNWNKLDSSGHIINEYITTRKFSNTSVTGLSGSNNIKAVGYYYIFTKPDTNEIIKTVCVFAILNPVISELLVTSFSAKIQNITLVNSAITDWNTTGAPLQRQLLRKYDDVLFVVTPYNESRSLMVEGQYFFITLSEYKTYFCLHSNPAVYLRGSNTTKTNITDLMTIDMNTSTSGTVTKTVTSSTPFRPIFASDSNSNYFNAELTLTYEIKTYDV